MQYLSCIQILESCIAKIKSLEEKALEEVNKNGPLSTIKTHGHSQVDMFKMIYRYNLSKSKRSEHV